MKQQKQYLVLEVYHEYVPLNVNEIGLKRTSEQEKFDTVFDYRKSKDVSVSLVLQVGQFVAANYDNLPWIIEIDLEHKDIL